MFGRGRTTAVLVHCLIITAQFTAAVHILVVVDLVLGGLPEGKLCDILQAMAPNLVETVREIILFHIESNLD